MPLLLNWKSRWALAALSFCLCIVIAAISSGALKLADNVASGTGDYNVTLGFNGRQIQVYAPDADVKISVHAWNGTVYRHYLPDSTLSAAEDTQYVVYSGIPFSIDIPYQTEFTDYTVCVDRTDATPVSVLAK